jgi:hypothetical protein
MIKKMATAALLLALTAALPARAEETDSLFSDVSKKKRFAINLIGLSGAVTACGAVFFFVGRSGAGLHVNPDGSLRVLGSLEEAESATSVQRVSTVMIGVGLAATVTGAVLLLLAREQKEKVKVAPMLTAGGGGLTLFGVFD